MTTPITILPNEAVVGITSSGFTFDEHFSWGVSTRFALGEKWYDHVMNKEKPVGRPRE